MNVRDKEFCILLLGSNIGEREKTISEAVSIIEDNGHISGLKRAGLYETEPVGYENQPMFINTCVSFYTDYDPHELLDFTQSVENSLHRERLVHWGPRTIDIDIIKFGEKVINDERLTVPHPRWKERAFVLLPMSELCDYEGEIPTDKMVRRIGPFI